MSIKDYFLGCSPMTGRVYISKTVNGVSKEKKECEGELMATLVYHMWHGMEDVSRGVTKTFSLGDKTYSLTLKEAEVELAELNEVLKHQIDIHKDEICDLRNELSRLRAGMAPI